VGGVDGRGMKGGVIELCVKEGHSVVGVGEMGLLCV
jgi:hypothetical protein